MIYNPESESGKLAFKDFVGSLPDLYLAELFDDLIAFNTEEEEHVPDIVFDIARAIELGCQTSEAVEKAIPHGIEIGRILTTYVEEELARRLPSYFDAAIQGDASLLRDATYHLASKLDYTYSPINRFYHETCRAFLSFISTDRLIKRSASLFPTQNERAILAMMLILDREKIEEIPPIPKIPVWRRSLAFSLNLIFGILGKNS